MKQIYSAPSIKVKKVEIENLLVDASGNAPTGNPTNDLGNSAKGGSVPSTSSLSKPYTPWAGDEEGDE